MGYNFIKLFEFHQYKMTQFDSLNVKLSNSQLIVFLMMLIIIN